MSDYKAALADVRDLLGRRDAARDAWGERLADTVRETLEATRAEQIVAGGWRLTAERIYGKREFWDNVVVARTIGWVDPQSWVIGEWDDGSGFSSAPIRILDIIAAWLPAACIAALAVATTEAETELAAVPAEGGAP